MADATISGDRPLDVGRIDRLGFANVAARIANSLVDQASDNGLVVGIDGEWGSGKSSLLYLIENALTNLPADRKPSIINFRPWVIGNRDALLAALFSALSDEINRVQHANGDATGVTTKKAKVAAERLRKFVSGLGKTGAAIEVAGEATANPLIKWGGKGVAAIGNMLSKKPTDPPLYELKDKLKKALRELNHRFIITIDDVDRLEPAEAVEILRLARSVADFPNVTYLLCFDSKVLSHSVEQAAGVENGEAYLEKITQLNVMVPLPETFRLRQWFTDELRELASTKNEDELSRLKVVIDYEGGRQLTTPRSVVRVLDAIRFFWPSIESEGADFADLVWIQLIKVGNPELYRWIEDYCATMAMISLGTVQVEAAEREAKREGLSGTVKPGHFADLHYRYYFAEPLPGAGCDYAPESQGFELFQRVSEADRDEAIRTCRLASPDHYRLYFALVGPEHALTQEDTNAFWKATDEGKNEICAIILRLHQECLPGGLGKADMLLERLKAAAPEQWTIHRGKHLLIAFSKVLDQAFHVRAFDLGWARSLWDRAESLIPFCLAGMDAGQRAEAIEQVFGQGEAIDWLVSLMRRETFAHGRYGNQTKPDTDWLFTDPELDRIFETMLERFGKMSAENILSTLRPLSLLFAWRQAGDEASPAALIQGHAETSAGLIQALQCLTSIRNSSDRGRYSALTRANVSPFINFDEARQRITELAGEDGPLAASAAELKLAFDDDDLL